MSASLPMTTQFLRQRGLSTLGREHSLSRHIFDAKICCARERRALEMQKQPFAARLRNPGQSQLATHRTAEGACQKRYSSCFANSKA